MDQFDPGAPYRDPPVVGRETEQEGIRRFLGDLPPGTRSLVVRGEAGIGKTTLWRHALREAGTLGFQVLSARPAEDEKLMALACLTDLFESVNCEAAVLADETPPMARGRAVLEALRQLAEQSPVVVAIDDLQWIDTASARALRFAIRRLDAEPIGILGSVRVGIGPEDPLDFNATLPPGRSATLEVGPFGLGDTRLLLASVVDAVSRPTLRRIHQVSGGNPLYAIELARYLVTGDPDLSSRLLALPDSLQLVISNRLDETPPELMPLLELLSVAGRTSVAQLRDLLPNSELDDVMAVAQASGLIVVAGNLVVRFAHPLVSSVVYARLSPMARRDLHGRLAERVADPELRARHLAQSTDGPDEHVASILEEAADRAAARGAPDAAAELAGYSGRFTASEDKEGIRRRSMAEIEHLAAAGEVGKAFAHADQLVAALPPGSARAEALVQRYELEDDDVQAADALLVRALSDAGDHDSLRAKVLLALSHHRSTYRGDLVGAIEPARLALEIAVNLGDAALEMTAASRLARVEGEVGVLRPDLTARAILLEDELALPPLYQSPRELVVGELLWAGDLSGARATLDAVRERAVEAGIEWKDLQHYYSLALLECDIGNLDAAEDAAVKAVEAARDAEDSLAERTILYAYALAESWLGRSSQARGAASRLVAESLAQAWPGGVMRGRRVLGLIALGEGDLRLAAEELGEAARISEEIGFGHPGSDRVLPDAVEALALAGSLDSAIMRLERLERQTEAVDSRWAHAASRRARGAFLLANGDPEASAAVLSDSVLQFDELGCGPDAARARLLEGRALMRLGVRSRAAEALADAHQRFSAMGAVLWQARATDELERAAPGRASGELTGTEGRIADLVAQGLRNRDISEALFISVATVEAHLTRIYRKLGIRSRSELARLVADGSLDQLGGRHKNM